MTGIQPFIGAGIPPMGQFSPMAPTNRMAQPSPTGMPGQQPPKSGMEALSAGDPQQGLGDSTHQMLSQILMMMSMLLQKLSEMLMGGGLPSDTAGEASPGMDNASSGGAGDGSIDPSAGGASPDASAPSDSADDCSGGDMPPVGAPGDSPDVTAPDDGAGASPVPDDAPGATAPGGECACDCACPNCGGGDGGGDAVDDITAPPATGGGGYDSSTPSTPTQTPPVGGAEQPGDHTDAGAVAKGGHQLGNIVVTDPNKYRKEVEAACKKNGLDPKKYGNIALAMIWQESKGDPLAVGNDGQGSKGVMQVTAANAKGYGDQFVPANSINRGVQMLADAVRNNNGNLSLALGEYNQGPGAKTGTAAQTYATQIQNKSKFFAQGKTPAGQPDPTHPGFIEPKLGTKV